MMKRVYICSPLGKDIKENLRKVRRYTKYALTCEIGRAVLLR